MTEGLGLPSEAGYLLDSVPNLDLPDLHGDEAQVVSSLLNLAWIVGDAKGFVEAVTGEDLITGRQLSKLDRALNLLPALARSGKLFTFAPEVKADLLTVADAVAAANAEIRASEAARLAALRAKDTDALQASTLAMLESFDRADGGPLRWADLVARWTDPEQLTTLNSQLAHAAVFGTLQRLDRIEAAIRLAGETDEPLAYLAALPHAADQVSDLGQFLEDLARVSPGVADSDGDDRPDMSAFVVKPGEVDSDGDGVPDMSVLQSPIDYRAAEDELEVGGEQDSFPSADPYQTGEGRPDEGSLSTPGRDADRSPDGAAGSGTSPQFDMTAYHSSIEGRATAMPEVEPGTGPLSNEAMEQRGSASQTEVALGTGPVSNETVEQRGVGNSQGATDETRRDAGSGDQSYAPASDELDVESASTDGDSHHDRDNGPYTPASDELVETDGRADQIDDEQLDYKQVEYEQCQSEQYQSEEVQSEG